MNYVLENEFNEILITVKEDIKKRINVDEYNSNLFILGMLKKEDSLLNCLCKIKYHEAVDYVIDVLDSLNKDNEHLENEEVYYNILNEAKEISRKDDLDIITDEHILYAILKIGKCEAINLLENFNVNTDMMLLTVNDYLELEEDSYLVNITEEVKKDKYHPFIGRDEYINKIIRVLFKKQKNNCMLIGPAGVGKTALVEGVAKKLIEYGYNESIYKLEIGSVISGTRYRGDLEERITDIIKKIREKKGILFIDEIQTIMGTNKGEESLSIGNLIKPMLSRSEIKCIGATTLDEYYESIAKDKAFARRFQNLMIPEPDYDETILILKKIKYKYEDYYNITYSNKVIERIVKCGKYFPNLKNPDKSIDLLDELGAYAVSVGVTKPNIKHLMKIVLENIGIKYRHMNNVLSKYYNKFLNINSNKKTIVNIGYYGNNVEILIHDIRKMFSLLDNNIVEIDIDLLDDALYAHMLKVILESSVCLVIIKNFNNAPYIIEHRFLGMINEGKIINQNNQMIYLNNTIFLFVEKESNPLGFDKEKNVGKKSYLDEIIV